MQPHEQLTLTVFLHRALPKIVAEHFARYTAAATDDMTLEESQARCDAHVDKMTNKSQEVLKHMTGVPVPEVIVTLVLAAYEVALYAIDKGVLDETVLNAMRQLEDLRRRKQ